MPSLDHRLFGLITGPCKKLNPIKTINFSEKLHNFEITNINPDCIQWKNDPSHHRLH